MIAGLFLGAMIGVAATLLFAMWLANKPKQPEAIKPVCHVASSGTETVNVAHARLLNHALEQAGAGKLFEIPTTRH